MVEPFNFNDVLEILKITAFFCFSLWRGGLFRLYVCKFAF